MSGVWVFGENFESSLELLNIGRELASQQKTKLVCLACQVSSHPQDLIDGGADEVLLLPDPIADQTLEAYIPVIVDEVIKEDPDIFLLSGTLRIKEMAARIAERLGTGLCSDCTSFRINPDSKLLETERLIFGGAAVQQLVCSQRPQMATIPVRTFNPAEKQVGRQGTVKVLPAPPISPIKLLEKKTKARQTGDIREAEVVVAVGRGVASKEDIEMIQELAELLNGELGCTRPVSEDMHWMPEDLCIGISAIEVKPQLYFGVGVSGQIQHAIGFRDAKVVCVINRDENAPIFDISNYGIVGDLYKVVPLLIEELKKAIIPNFV